MDRDLWFLLAGAGIALGSSIITAIVTAVAQHKLSLRADRIKREREMEAEQARELRVGLLEGIAPGIVRLSDGEPVIPASSLSGKIRAAFWKRAVQENLGQGLDVQEPSPGEEPEEADE